MAWARVLGRSAFYVAAAALVIACSSDDSSGGTGGKGGGGTGGKDGGGSGGADAAAGAAGQPSSGGQGGAAGSDAGCTPGDVTLQNDAFVTQGQVAFEGGFAIDECWASTFVPNACNYDIKSALVLIGGGDGGSADFGLEVWDVDATGKPETMLASTQVTITGASDVLSEIPIDPLGLPSRDGTPFAIAMCHVSHAGAPSIGRDGNGITPNRNWIFTGGAWAEASTLGVTGDWITRAVITVK